MTGEKLYELYSKEMAKLPSHITKGEALPAWHFLNGPLAAAWDRVGEQVMLAPKRAPMRRGPDPKPVKKAKKR